MGLNINLERERRKSPMQEDPSILSAEYDDPAEFDPEYRKKIDEAGQRLLFDLKRYTQAAKDITQELPQVTTERTASPEQIDQVLKENRPVFQEAFVIHDKLKTVIDRTDLLINQLVKVEEAELRVELVKAMGVASLQLAYLSALLANFEALVNGAKGQWGVVTKINGMDATQIIWIGSELPSRSPDQYNTLQQKLAYERKSERDAAKRVNRRLANIDEIRALAEKDPRQASLIQQAAKRLAARFKSPEVITRAIEQIDDIGWQLETGIYKLASIVLLLALLFAGGGIGVGAASGQDGSGDKPVVNEDEIDLGILLNDVEDLFSQLLSEETNVNRVIDQLEAISDDFGINLTQVRQVAKVRFEHAMNLRAMGDDKWVNALTLDAYYDEQVPQELVDAGLDEETAAVAAGRFYGTRPEPRAPLSAAQQRAVAHNIPEFAGPGDSKPPVEPLTESVAFQQGPVRSAEMQAQNSRTGRVLNMLRGAFRGNRSEKQPADRERDDRNQPALVYTDIPANSDLANILNDYQIPAYDAFIIPMVVDGDKAVTTQGGDDVLAAIQNLGGPLADQLRGAEDLMTNAENAQGLTFQIELLTKNIDGQRSGIIVINLLGTANLNLAGQRLVWESGSFAYFDGKDFIYLDSEGKSGMSTHMRLLDNWNIKVLQTYPEFNGFDFAPYKGTLVMTQEQDGVFKVVVLAGQAWFLSGERNQEIFQVSAAEGVDQVVGFDDPHGSEYVTTETKVNIRAAANRDSADLGDLMPGDRLIKLAEVTGEAVNGISTWYEVLLPDGSSGFVAASLVFVNDNGGQDVPLTPDMLATATPVPGVDGSFVQENGTIQLEVDVNGQIKKISVPGSKVKIDRVDPKPADPAAADVGDGNPNVLEGAGTNAAFEEQVQPELASSFIGEGRATKVLDNGQLQIYDTAAFRQQYPDGVHNVILEDPRVIQYEKTMILRRLVMKYTDQTPTLEEVAANPEQFLAQIGDQEVSLGDRNDIGLPAGKITVRELIENEWIVVRMAKNFVGTGDDPWVATRVVGGQVTFFAFRPDVNEVRALEGFDPRVALSMLAGLYDIEASLMVDLELDAQTSDEESYYVIQDYYPVAAVSGG